MDKIFNTLKIKKAKKTYDELLNGLYKSDTKFEEEKRKAGCLDCVIYLSDYRKLKLEDMFKKCESCKNQKKVMEARDGYLKRENEIDNAKKAYAEAVFDVLKDIKPKLYSRPDKKTIEWDAAFPNQFTAVNPLMYQSLLAFVDGVGGRYIMKG